MTPKILLNVVKIQKSKRNLILSMLKHVLESFRAFYSDHGMFNHQSKGYCVKEKRWQEGEVGEMVGGISFGWGCQEKYSHTRLHLHTYTYTYMLTTLLVEGSTQT